MAQHFYSTRPLGWDLCPSDTSEARFSDAGGSNPPPLHLQGFFETKLGRRGRASRVFRASSGATWWQTQQYSSALGGRKTDANAPDLRAVRNGSRIQASSGQGVWQAIVGARAVVVCGRKHGLIAAVGLVLVAPLLASCADAPSTSNAETTLTTISSVSLAPSTIPETPTTPYTESDAADWLGTTSTATLPASEPAFHQELSGAGYYCTMVHTVPQGAQGWTPPGKLGPSNTAIMEVLVWVDPATETRATYDLIYNHAITMAKKHGIADSTGGRLRVVLFDAASGEFIGEHIVESRDFDLGSTASLEPTTPTVTSSSMTLDVTPITLDCIRGLLLADSPSTGERELVVIAHETFDDWAVAIICLLDPGVALFRYTDEGWVKDSEYSYAVVYGPQIDILPRSLPGAMLSWLSAESWEKPWKE